MKKLEKKYINKMVTKILEIESQALLYTSEDIDNEYASECFAEEVSSDINFYINKMIDRNVNQNIIEQLKSLDWALWCRNLNLYKG